MKPEPADLLEALPYGKVIWLAARGRSMVPLLRTGDALLARRCLESDLVPGDIAVLRLPGVGLLAHLVTKVAPLSTSSLQGVEDAGPGQVLGKAIALRVRGLRIPLGAVSRPLLLATRQVLSGPLRARPVMQLRRWLHQARGAKATAAWRRSRMNPVTLETQQGAAPDVVAYLSEFRAVTQVDLVGLSNAAVHLARTRGEDIVAACACWAGVLREAFVAPGALNLGLEEMLLEHVPTLPSRARVRQDQQGFLTALYARGFVFDHLHGSYCVLVRPQAK